MQRFEGHTHGRWSIMDHGDPHNVYVGVTLRDFPRSQQHVCKIMGWGADYPDDPEQQANARLIAAAPTLLEQRDRLAEALRRIMEWDYRTDRRHRGMVDMEEMEYVKRAARAALAELEE